VSRLFDFSVLPGLKRASLKYSVKFSLVLLLVFTGMNLPLALFDTAQAAEPVAIESSALSQDEKIAQSLKQTFRESFQKTIEEAESYLQSQKACRWKRKQQAVVMDLDETLMDNRAYFIVHKQYQPQLWDQWVEEGEASAIPESVAFYQWLKKQGYAVYFISGRREKLREITVKNLSRMGIKDYQGLYLKPNDFHGTSASDFKINARKDIEAKGKRIVLSIGDQESDLKGGYGKGFKLPNSIYTVP
jgi:5'-nucleotidase (lipoprotein e(P4) family)